MYDFVNEELFDLEKSNEYILSIQVSLGGFSFSVVSSDNKLLVFKDAPLKISNETLIARRLKEWLDSDDIFLNRFKTVRVIVFNENFTLVPEKYVSEELKRNIPQLLFTEDIKAEVAENDINLSETRLVYALPPGLTKVLSKKIGEYEIVHPIQIISRHIPEPEEKHGIILLFDAKNLYLVLYSENNISLANSYKVNHLNDVIYYTLSTLKQLEISPKLAELFFAGEMNQENEAILQLQNYFNSVKGLPCKSPLEFDSALMTQPIHQNLSLFS